ncbi:MAG: hypothetical protein JW700_02720 [Candidatus Aenigmarchaeota archaeon]|nr:hypothetical protein [Candidatus Aenigmarchaeota archaeon]
MVVELTLESILVFMVFIVVIFVSYKMFRFFVRAALVSVAGFVFPWVANYMGLPLVTNIETAITFSFIGLILFISYESYHKMLKFFKAIKKYIGKKRTKK